MNEQGEQVFQFFTEIGIIDQLSSAALQKLLPDGLHLSHFSVLNHLVRVHDGVTPLRIANAFQVTKGTMTNTLSVLSKKDLIRIVPHKTDGRSKVVFITEEGIALQEEAIASLFPAIQELDSKIDWSRVVALIPELARIREVLDEDRNPI